MGKNKAKRFAENLTFPNLVQTSFEEVFQQAHPLKGRWARELFHNDKPLVLELGCGRGEYTLALARRYPQYNFIGVDIKGARLWRGAKTALEEGLDNAGFLRTRIEFIANIFAEDEVSELWLTFPDPQLKRENRRLTNPRFLTLYSQFLQDGALVHLKTDSQELHQYTVQQAVEAENLTLQLACNDIYGCRLPEIVPVLEVKTYYESLFMAEGKTITYLKMRFFKSNLSSLDKS